MIGAIVDKIVDETSKRLDNRAFFYCLFDIIISFILTSIFFMDYQQEFQKFSMELFYYIWLSVILIIGIFFIILYVFYPELRLIANRIELRYKHKYPKYSGISLRNCLTNKDIRELIIERKNYLNKFYLYLVIILLAIALPFIITFLLIFSIIIAILILILYFKIDKQDIDAKMLDKKVITVYFKRKFLKGTQTIRNLDLIFYRLIEKQKWERGSILLQNKIKIEIREIEIVVNRLVRLSTLSRISELNQDFIDNQSNDLYNIKIDDLVKQFRRELPIYQDSINTKLKEIINDINEGKIKTNSLNQTSGITLFLNKNKNKKLEIITEYFNTLKNKMEQVLTVEIRNIDTCEPREIEQQLVEIANLIEQEEVNTTLKDIFKIQSVLWEIFNDINFSS